MLSMHTTFNERAGVLELTQVRGFVKTTTTPAVNRDHGLWIAIKPVRTCIKADSDRNSERERTSKRCVPQTCSDRVERSSDMIV